MLCSTCQEIFKASEFFETKIASVGPRHVYHKHTEYTRDIRDSAMYSGYQLCAMLCLHFDREDDKNRPIERLDLQYDIAVLDGDLDEDEHEVTAASQLGIRFFYVNQSALTVLILNIDDEKGVRRFSVIETSLKLSHRCPSVHPPKHRLVGLKCLVGRRNS